MVESRNNKKIEDVHQILHGNNIEPPISENHIRMQIIASFAHYMHIIISSLQYSVFSLYLTKDLNSSWKSMQKLYNIFKHYF